MQLAVDRATAAPVNPTRRRMIAFRVLGTIFFVLGLTLLEGVTEGLMPWTTIGCPGCVGDYDPAVHRWHGAFHGAFIVILLAGSMLGLVLRPVGRELLLAFYVTGFAILNITFIAFSYQEFSELQPGAGLTLAVVMALLLFTHPTSRRMLKWRSGWSFSRPLLGLSLASAVVLAPQIWQSLENQINGTVADQHAVAGRWAEGAVVMIVLALAGLVTSSRRPGWTWLGMLVGVAYLYLGTAALTVPDQPGSWGTLGGVLAISAGAAYLGLTYRESKAVSVEPHAEAVLRPVVE